jgi:ATP adenylyltransferase
MEYIEMHKSEDACVFCRAAGQNDGPGNLVVHRGERAFVIINRYPYTSGHLMVVPYEHHPSLDDLDPLTRSEMMELITEALRIVQDLYRPQGFNVGVNIGVAAGAGIEEHIHMHLVPRWAGDTNFMSSLGETRVLPEALEETYRRLRQAWG